MVNFLNSLKGGNKALLRVWRSDPAYHFGGYDLPDLPPSVAMILAKTSNSAAAQGRTSTVAALEFGPGDAVVTGSKTIQVEVRE
jgi:hypothetical protein